MKSKHLLLAAFFILLSAAQAQTMLYTKNITATTAELNWSFDLEPKQNIYYGAAAPSSEMAAFNADAGKTVAIVHKYMAWGSSYNKFDPNSMNNIRNGGSIPMITWEPWDHEIIDPRYTLTNIINGDFDAYILEWATAAKNWKHPFFLRFAHEMNGKTWYPWQEGLNGNISGQYVKAYKHVFDIFRSVGANNVVWVWNPNVKFSGSTPMTGLYPGDEYVHWVGVNGYNRATSSSNWKTFRTVYDATLTELKTIAPTKKILIGEISSSETGGSKADWITDALNTQVPSYPNIKAFVWFNNVKSFDWRIQSSPSATVAFKNAIANSYYLSNSFANIGASSYTIQYKELNETNWKTTSTNSLSLQLTGLKPNTTYEFKVQATLNSGGLSAFSSPKIFATQTDGNVITGIEDKNPSGTFSFYPNPFSGEGFIKTTSAITLPLEIKIIDLRGALVYFSNKHFTNEKINIGAELASGLYILELRAGEEKRYIKIVKGE